jgi:branched-chain amino acid transport system ATP-binding protein
VASEGLQATPLLDARGIAAGYHGRSVIRDLDLVVRRGEIVGILGPNGAGKTTTLLALAGELPLMQGKVLLSGTATRAPLHVRAAVGMAFVPEERSVFMQLTVKENLRVGRVNAARATGLFPELEPLMNRTAAFLSGGEQQMLTLARALARSPKVLLGDELSHGLAPLVVRRLLDAVRHAVDTMGLGVLLVEQHLRQLTRIADRLYVMERGRVVLAGPTDVVMASLGRIEDVYMSTESS